MTCCGRAEKSRAASRCPPSVCRSWECPRRRRQRRCSLNQQQPPLLPHHLRRRTHFIEASRIAAAALHAPLRTIRKRKRSSAAPERPQAHFHRHLAPAAMRRTRNPRHDRSLSDPLALAIMPPDGESALERERRERRETVSCVPASFGP